MEYSAELRRGQYVIDLSGGVFSLMRDFVPPALVEDVSISEGSSLNKWGGARLIRRKSSSREFSFRVKVQGTSIAQTEKEAERLINFLKSGKRRKPVYFGWRSEEIVPFQPIYGTFGSAHYSEVVAVLMAEPSGGFGAGDLRSYRMFVDISIQINPPESLRQVAAYGSGGVLEDIWTSPDGVSRGMIAAEGTTNLHTNPRIQSPGGGTWNYGSNVKIRTQTSTGEGVFLDVITWLTAIGATLNTYTQFISLAASTHTLYYYVRLRDGGAVTSAHVQIIYNGTLRTTTYEAIGNGVYRIRASVTGTGANAETGIEIKNGKTIALLFAQAEAKTYPTPPCHGHLPGCSWSSVEDGSSSTRVNGLVELYYSKTFYNEEGTFIIAVKMNNPYDLLPNFIVLDSSGTVSMQLKYDAATDKWQFTDGVTTLADATVDQFSIGAIRVLAASWAPGGMQLFRNGSRVANTANFNRDNFGTKIAIGSIAGTPSSYANATVLGFGIYNRAVTQTQGEALTAALLAHVQGSDGFGQRFSPIPYVWGPGTFTGSFDTCTGLVGATQEYNWCFVAGVPGTLPAKVKASFAIANGSFGFFESAFWMGLTKISYSNFAEYTLRHFLDMSGVTDTGNACGNAYKSIALPTATPRASSGLEKSISDYLISEMIGNFHFFVRMKADAAHTVNVGFYLRFNGTPIWTEDKVISVGTGYKLYYIGKLGLDFSTELFDMGAGELSVGWGVNFGCADASGSLHIDFAAVINGAMQVLDIESVDMPGGGSTAAYAEAVTFEGLEMQLNQSTANPIRNGELIEVEPDMYNMLSVFLGDDAAAHDIGWFGYLLPGGDGLLVTPRWAFS